MANSEVLPLGFNGPDGVGLTKLELDQADFQSDLPEQHWHVYHEDEALGITVGVWTTTSMQEKFGPYPGDEFMCILEGQVVMVDGEGAETLVKSSETFCIRNGTPTSWKQDGFLRKFFITHNRPDGVMPDVPTSNNGVVVLDQDALKNELQELNSLFPFEFAGTLPVQRDASVFVNDTNDMFVGMWESAPFESLMRPFPCNEFVQLLDGEITISEQSGRRHMFLPGDVFFIPAGTVCSWNTTGRVRKFYCMIVETSEEHDA